MTDSAVAEARETFEGPVAAEAVCVQSAGFLLELSLDWIVLRASENVGDFLGESHVTLIDEPLGRFVMAQPLHDLRNLFSRLSATTGIARAYGVRLTNASRRFDLAFQLSAGRVLIEGIDTRDGFGETFSTVGGLAEGLRGLSGEALLDGAARRMRALAGFDRACITSSGRRVESRRGSGSGPALCSDLPAIVADTDSAPVPIFPRQPNDPAAAAALLRSPNAAQRDELRAAGVASTMRVPIPGDGCFECDSRTARSPSFELHAAAELFAQVVGMRLEIDELGSGV
jgi:light-regulated signal transduction histidine kinase (bacteriophytochrome)